MRPSSPFRRAVLSIVLGTSLALPSASASAFAPSARQRSEQLLAEGDAASAKERWDEAISKYRASYYGLPPEDQPAYMGSLTVRKAMRAYQERVAQTQDPGERKAVLERQRVMLEEFLAAVTAKPGAAEEIGDDVIAELEQIRSSIDAALAEPSGTTEPEPQPDDTTGAAAPGTDGSTASTSSTSSTTPTDRSDRTTKPTRDWLGLGLVIGGSVTLATGLGVTAGRWTIRSGALERVDNGGEDYAPGTDARADYLEQEYARATKFLVAGAVVAGVGLAATIAGVVHIAVRRRRAAGTTALNLVPALSPSTAGLVLHRRF